MSWKSLLFSGLIITLCVVIGWHIGTPQLKREKSPLGIKQTPLSPSTSRAFTAQKSAHPNQEEAPDAIPNERILSFSSPESLEAFLRKAQSKGVSLLGTSAFGNRIRVRFENLGALRSILPDDAKSLLNYIVYPPSLEEGALNAGAVGFEGRMKEWMGIHEDNSDWGAGVKVAVLDTGIQNHEVFANGVTAFSLVDNKEGTLPNPHGTAMASLWRDGEGRIPAIAPAVDLFSYQVADETGISNLFLLSEAIYLATDQGADLITISMGATQTNDLLGDAIAYAKQNGALIVASAGNNGEEVALFPASHPDVLSIGAIDFLNNYPGFSNTGDQISFVAPGVGVLAAGEDGSYTLSTGTSPAAQIGAATIAATMSELHISDPYEAYELLRENLNELGVPGDDNIFGEGRPQMDVILNYDQPGIYDGAIAAGLFNRDGNTQSGQIQIVVDNPGTEPLSKASLFITANGKSYETPLPEVSPKESFLFNLPIPISLDTENLSISSHVKLENGLQDARPNDNSIQASFSLSNE